MRDFVKRKNNFTSRLNTNRQTTNSIRNMSRKLTVESTRVNGPLDPPPITRDIIVTKIFRKKVLVTNNAPILINQEFVFDCVPGGSTVFDRFRIEKISVYAPAYIVGTTLNDIILSIDEDQATFEDEGTYGQKRPTLHVRPALNSRIVWHGINFSGNVAQVLTSSTTGIEVVIDLTIGLRTVSQTCPS